MPRDPGTGVYTLPLPPTEPRRIPVTDWANVTVEDLAASMNNIPGGALADGSITPTKLAGMTLNGLVTRIGASTFAESVIMGTPGEIVVTNGNGVADHPSIGLASSPTLQGDVSLAGGQLSFPLAQSPSSNPNTLDDYEEGTFTPSITFSTPGNQSITYNVRSGVYTKIGDMVFVSIILSTATFTHTTASGGLDVTGLPFASGSPTAGSIGYSSGLTRGGTAGFYAPAVLFTAAVVRLYVVGPVVSGGTATGASADHTSGESLELRISGCYKVA